MVTHQHYAILTLQGTARVVEDDDLPPVLFKHWGHSHKEDVGDVDVYRPPGEPLPACGRTAFEIKCNSACVQHERGPIDAPQRVVGRWTVQGTRHLHVERDDGQSLTLSSVALDEDVLRVTRKERHESQLPVVEEQFHD